MERIVSFDDFKKKAMEIAEDDNNTTCFSQT